MTGLLTDYQRVRHILDAIDEVENYLNGISFEDFEKDSEKRFATIKQLKLWEKPVTG